MPLSYATYTGNGSTTTFSVPFPYLLKSHVKVFIGFNILTGTYTSELVDGVGFTWSSGTQIQCTTAPTAAQTLTVTRQTPSSTLIVDWNDGSNLIAADMDTADLQNLYVVQEQQDRNDAGISASLSATTAANTATTAATTATSTANTALSTANTALTNANTAVSTANTASTNASAAVTTANTASTNASAAVTTANTASTNASAAVATANAASSTANTASTNASAAVTTANTAAADAATALSTANTALTNANTAVTTANTASSNASAAVTTANTASTNASNAVTTANTASTNASSAVTTANAADNKADQAIAAVSNSINYQLKANVAAIPASPANDTYIEVQDSTGLESFTPLAGTPAGFVGDSGLSVRLRYTSAGSTWNWLNYYANNADARYLKQIGGTLTGQLKADDSTSAATPGYAFDGDPNTGVGRPGADELALITGGTARLTIDSAGNVAVAGSLATTGTSTAASFIPSSSTAPANGLYLPSANNVAISTNGTGRLFINSSGQVGVGTTAPSQLLEIKGANARFAVNSTTVADGGILLQGNGTTYAEIKLDASSGILDIAEKQAAGNITFSTGTAPTERARIDSSGRVGIGTSSPASIFHVSGSADQTYTLQTTTAGADNRINFRNSAGTDAGGIWYMHGGNHLLFNTGGSNQEKARIDGSGRLLVGTSSSINNVYVGGASYQSPFQVIGNAAGYGNGLTSLNYSAGGYAATLTLGSSKNATVGANGAVASGDDLGIINFVGNDGTNFRTGAYIIATADGTTGTADLPTRLAFWTTPDGTAAPVERLRINSSGNIGIGNSVATPGSYSNTGSSFGADGYIIASRQDANIIYVNRKGSDGQLIEFAQDGVPEGGISVSGTTVSYNGAHLSRWSQLPSGAERAEILRGSVLSNIDEMCEWGDEDNEQLNRMKVSDVEGDKNVSGVFQAWDDDDDTYTNDFYCAMTGDFIIRIGAGVTVERGDLLVSAGDGTAKPQDDDIIRSKTIAKVTSTNVSCTYDDGSYCVPCVLMAC